jgi:ribosome-binding ATPase YchF (GTP1/OBG family)
MAALARMAYPVRSLTNWRKWMGFVHVVRQFENLVCRIRLEHRPVRDIQTMDTEFILNDLVMVERRLERLREEYRRGVTRDRALIQQDIDLFERLQAVLERELPLRHYDFTPEEDKTLASFQFSAASRKL